MTTSILMMDDSNREWNYIGSSIRVDTWWANDGFFTIAAHLHNFKGRFLIEGSLMDVPTEDDWFAIWLSASSPYVEYPRNPASPTGGVFAIGDTLVDAFTFRGRFVWLRARLDRSYIIKPTTDEEIANYGVIKRVLLNT